MLDLRQRLILWAAGLTGCGLTLLLGLPHPRPGAGGTFWPNEPIEVVATWEESPFLNGGLPLAKGILEAAARHGVDPALLAALISAESGFRHDAVSAKGAQGLMQLMPDTATSLGVTLDGDPHANLEAGTKYLASLLEQFGGDVELALAAYNAGPGAVRRWGTIPPFRETGVFVQRVRDAYRELTGVELRSAARLVVSTP